MERESITLAVKLVDGPDGAVKKETNSFDIFRDNIIVWQFGTVPNAHAEH